MTSDGSFSLTRFTNLQGPLSKEFSWEDNQLIKSAHGNLFYGVAERLKFNTLGEFKEELERIEERKVHNVAYSTAVFHGDSNARMIVPKNYINSAHHKLEARRLARERGFEKAAAEAPIARDKDHFSFVTGRGLLFMDSDFNFDKYSTDTVDTARTALALIRERGLIPALQEMSGISFEETEYLELKSSSNGLIDPSGNIIESEGVHAYVVVENQRVTLAWINDLFNRCVANGYGWLHEVKLRIKDRDARRYLKRGPIDLAVASPERLIYESTPILEKGLKKLTRKVRHGNEGGSAVTGEVGASSRRLNSRVKDFWRPVLDDKGRTEYLEGESLSFDHIVILKDMSETTIGELYKQAQEADIEDDRKTQDFYDPIEGVGYGHPTATYFHSEGRNPMVYSQAHGGMLYRIDVPPAVRVEQAVERTRSSGFSELGSIQRLTQVLSVRGWEIWYNQFSEELVLKSGDTYEQLDDHVIGDIRTVWNDISEQEEAGEFPRVGKEELIELLFTYSRNERSFHPVKDWLEGLKEPVGVRDYFKEVTERVFGVEPTPYNVKVFRMFFIAAVKRIYEPGCKWDHIPILIGTQGAKKSTAIRCLVPNESWFTDSLTLGEDSKTFLEKTHGKWIAEIPELVGGNNKEVRSIKNMVTITSDRSRMAYGRMTVERKRSVVMMGTTNESEILRDTTGNRRFLPVEVGGCDPDAAVELREGLYYQAMQNIEEPLYISDEEVDILTEALERQREHTDKGPYYDAITSAFPGLLVFEGGAILKTEFLNAVREELGSSIGKVTSEVNRNIVRAIEGLGYVKKSVRYPAGADIGPRGVQKMFFKRIDASLPDNAHPVRSVDQLQNPEAKISEAEVRKGGKELTRMPGSPKN